MTEIIAMLAAVAAGAQVQKRVAPDGTVRFSDRPGPRSDHAIVVTLDEQSMMFEDGDRMLLADVSRASAASTR